MFVVVVINVAHGIWAGNKEINEHNQRVLSSHQWKDLKKKSSKNKNA